MDTRAKLQRILQASGMTQQALALEIGTSLVSLNNWLNGKATPTRRVFLERIATLYVTYLGLEHVEPDEFRTLKAVALNQRLSAGELIGNPEMLRTLTVVSTYNTNTIEGSTMTESDVDAVLFGHAVLSNRTQFEQRETVNHRVALEHLLSLLTETSAFEFTPDLIERVHLLLMSGILSNAGTWRNHGVRIQGSHVVLANHVKIPVLIDRLCEDLNEPGEDPIAQLARTHANFEQIHPFSDGNGRVGRLLMLTRALQLGFVPPVVEQQRKTVYYKYLQLAQTEEKFDFLEQLVAESILATALKLAPHKG